VKADKKEARRREQLAALFGMETPPAQTGPTRRQRSQDASREAEAVINYFRHPNQWLEYGRQRCDNPKCNNVFMANRANVGSCSDACRAALCEELGLTWDWTKPPDQRWSVRSVRISPDGKKMEDTSGELTREPLVITGAALAAVDELERLQKEEVELQTSVVNNSVDIASDDVDDFDDFLANLGG
jgi:hypothetical protein